MRRFKSFIALALGMWVFATSAYAYYDPARRAPKPNKETVNFREACITAKAQIDQNINNVRARLTAGGDVWWDRNDGKYVVPNVEAGQTEVSSIFAGAVWLGGIDPGGNLKVACQTYGNGSNSSDFWSGPIDPDEGTTSKEICDKWDRFFVVTAEEIKLHLELYQNAVAGLGDYTEDMIPAGVKGWPAKGNPYFFSVHQFDLPSTDQGLAGFWNEDPTDLGYDPLQGDFPIIEIRGCEELPPQFPDQMIFWIYNDEGGGAAHAETEGLTIRMEVQVQAFAYATNDQVNDMTFQRYKLINRAKEDIDSTYFAIWVDADLGCYIDDYVGCDVERSLAYTYNEDGEDGAPGITCPGGVATYGTEIPIIGIDYFRGPLDENRNELGMSSFTYFNNNIGGPPPGTIDPASDVEFYNYLSGSWRDGTPFTFGEDAYDPTSTQYIDYAFVDAPDDQDGWSMCTAGLPPYDRRTVQASGPFTLQPGAVNELIIGAVWVPNLDYPCPDITRLQYADDIAQDLFDNCFDLVDGPDAPDVDWVELDRKLIGVLTNKTTSNNYQEKYEEIGIGFPSGVDTTYNFEGYRVYQLAGPNVGGAELDDINLARPVFEVDVRNGAATLYNWLPIPNPGAEFDASAPDFIFYPEAQVEGLDQGVRHTFEVTEDQFATSDRRLINHRRYYFTAVAYGYNNYKQYDPLTETGQKITYLEGRNNIRTYKPTPRPIIDRMLNADYGDGPVITRIDGIGVGGNFLDMSAETKAKILDGTFDGEIVYEAGRGPIDVRVFNPLEVKDGEFEVTFIDENMGNSKLDNEVYWQFKDLNSNDPVTISEKSIEFINEQIFGKYGFTISIGQTDDAGDWADETDGGIGAEIAYGSLDKPFWFTGIQDEFTVPGVPVNGYFDYVRHKDNWENRDHEVLATLGAGYFMPYHVTDWETRAVAGGGEYPFYVTPAWRANNSNPNLANGLETELKDLNNVDIVFTSDKSKWSRCVIVDLYNPDYENFALREDSTDIVSVGEAESFDLRNSPSVGKEDANGDGLPDPDGDGIGMGWFPGYAVDVETGKRLNIFFGENSAYSAENGFLNLYTAGAPNGADMMFNPNSQVLLNQNTQDFTALNNPMQWYAGGQHFVYVTEEEYDGCVYLRERLGDTQLKKVNAIKRITWAGLPMVQTGQRMLSYAEGLIPNEVTVKLRVDNPYEVETGTGDFNGYPTYRFKLEGKQAAQLDNVGVENALDAINVVPNPYYAFSEYEDSRLSTVVKITNLPAKCTVTIYTLDGKFIRQYNRDEKPLAPYGNGIPGTQVIPDLEWDLKNSKNVPVSGGVYLIHVNSELGERTLKWFGVTRQFDPTGL